MKIQIVHMHDPCIRELHAGTVGVPALLRHQDSLSSFQLTEYNNKGLAHAFGLQGLQHGIALYTDFIW
jgi:hypothetical protein